MIKYICACYIIQGQFKQSAKKAFLKLSQICNSALIHICMILFIPNIAQYQAQFLLKNSSYNIKFSCDFCEEESNDEFSEKHFKFNLSFVL